MKNKYKKLAEEWKACLVGASERDKLIIDKFTNHLDKREEECDSCGFKKGSAYCFCKPKPKKEEEIVCREDCPDYHGMEILHKEECSCDCHKLKKIEKLDLKKDENIVWDLSENQLFKIK